MKTADILREQDFEEVAETKLDAKHRVSLGKAVEDVINVKIYKVYCNSNGQIILDPQVTIPASEAWIYKNQDVLNSIRSGLNDARSGKVHKAKEDYSKYIVDKD